MVFRGLQQTATAVCIYCHGGLPREPDTLSVRPYFSKVPGANLLSHWPLGSVEALLVEHSGWTVKLTERVLENEYVRLEPLHELHREPLREAANADREIWTLLYPYSMAGEHFDPFWVLIQNDHRIGSWILSVVIASGQCVGLTCYIRPEAAHRCVDIGSTYDTPVFRRE